MTRKEWLGVAILVIVMGSMISIMILNDHYTPERMAVMVSGQTVAIHLTDLQLGNNYYLHYVANAGTDWHMVGVGKQVWANQSEYRTLLDLTTFGDNCRNGTVSLFRVNPFFHTLILVDAQDINVNSISEDPITPVFNATVVHTSYTYSLPSKIEEPMTNIVAFALYENGSAQVVSYFFLEGVWPAVWNSTIRNNINMTLRVVRYNISIPYPTNDVLDNYTIPPAEFLPIGFEMFEQPGLYYLAYTIYSIKEDYLPGAMTIYTTVNHTGIN